MVSLPATIDFDLVRRQHGQGRIDYSGCTVETCNINTSFFAYRPSLAANTFFVVIYGLCLIGFLVTYGITRRGLAFTVALCAGCTLEVLGYAGRLMAWKNPWNEVRYYVPSLLQHALS
jgi:hypothetical protein